MKFEVFRGLSNLVFAPISFDENGLEVWGKVQPLSGVQSIETALEESNEVVYFDNQPSIALTAEGDDKYTLNVSVPYISTRAMLEGKKWDNRRLAYLSTETESRYYAVGFKAGLVGTEKIQEYYWIYKGKFTTGSISHQTEDNGTTHNTVQYTFTSVYTTRTWEGEPLKYMAIDSTHPMAADFLNFVFTPDNLSNTNVFGIDFDLANISTSAPLSGVGQRLDASVGLEFHRYIGGRQGYQRESDFSSVGPWKGIHRRLRDVSTGELIAVSGTEEFDTILGDPLEAVKYNLFTYFPTFWASWKQEDRSGRRHWVIKVSTTPFPDAQKFGGKEVSCVFMESGYKVTPERVPLTGTSLDTFNANTTDSDSSYIEVENWMDRMMYMMLFLVETGDMNSQRQARGISDLWWTPTASGTGSIVESVTAGHTVTIPHTDKIHAGMNLRINACGDGFWSGTPIYTGMVIDVDNTGENTVLDFGPGASITATADTDGVGFTPQPVSTKELLAMGDKAIGFYDAGGTEGGNHSFIYGMADTWGNIYGWLNGASFETDHMIINGVPGKTISDERFNSGNPGSWDFDNFHLWPEDFTGSSAINFGDYFYVNRDARTGRACRAGGFWGYGSDGGLCCFFWDAASSNPSVNIGARAVKKS